MSGRLVGDSRHRARRRLRGRAFQLVCAGMTFFGVVLLFVLLFGIGRQGAGYVDWQFLSSFPSRFPDRAGILSAIAGTVWLVGLTGLISVPVGIGAAIYLEEFAGRSRFARTLEVNIANLAGVPSIIYGMLGLTVFVRTLGFGRSILAGALTMSLLVLPVIIVASREALSQVPNTFRHAAFALGASKWETVRHHVLPAAIPGILTGVILALSRAIGETAPLVVIGAFAYVAFVPEGPMDDFTVLPIQIFNWASRPQKEFHDLSAAAIIVLLAVLLLMNATAVWIRQRARRNRPW